MKTIEQSIELLSQIETKRPPAKLYDKIRRRVFILKDAF